jgi:adenosylcobinamide kinase/adenosylcobinamide-phosphate guanylyltransferase
MAVRDMDLCCGASSGIGFPPIGGVTSLRPFSSCRKVLRSAGVTGLKKGVRVSNLPRLSLVLGGAASGKSGFAEALVTGTGRNRVYLATAQAFDDEMQAKLLRHRVMRGPDWRTIEAPLDLAPALGQAAADDIVLLDCITMWLSNHLLAEHDLETAQSALIGALDVCAAPVVMVSNEVGLSVVPDNALARRFRDAQGRVNQVLAARSELVVHVIAGLPQVLRGTLP